MKNIAGTSCTCKGGQRRGGSRRNGQGERQDHGGEAQGGRGEGGDCLMLRFLNYVKQYFFAVGMVLPVLECEKGKLTWSKKNKK